MGSEKSYFSWASKESLGKEREKVVARLTRSQIFYSSTGALLEKSGLSWKNY